MRSTNKMQLRVYRGAIRISFILVVSFTTARMPASNPEIPWRNLVVHGPFEVGDKDLISASAQEGDGLAGDGEFHGLPPECGMRVG